VFSKLLFAFSKKSIALSADGLSLRHPGRMSLRFNCFSMALWSWHKTFVADYTGLGDASPACLEALYVDN